jgi:rod shape determining protein RodA
MYRRQRPTDTETINISSYDRPILMLYYMLVFIGWMMIYASTYQPSQPFALLDLGTDSGKQFMFIIICTSILTFIAFTSSGMWKILSMVFYIAAMVLLAGVLFFGTEVNGANAWYRIGSFGFQPAEIAKFGTAMAVANTLSGNTASLRDRRTQLTLAALIFFPIFLILLQPDAGSALVFTAFMVPLYREGVDGNWYLLAFGTAGLVVLGLIWPPAFVVGVLLILYGMFMASSARMQTPALLIGVALLAALYKWKTIYQWLSDLAQRPNTTDLGGELTYLGLAMVFFLVQFVMKFNTSNRKDKDQMQINMILLTLGSGLVFLADYFCFTVLAPHQQERIKVWLRPEECDPRGSLYNILHSKMAISSGGFSGKGFLDGNMTKLKYVPEQNTDFIFCTISEEQGFIGVIATLVLFGILVYRILVVSERSRSNFTRIYGYTVAGILMVHFIVNTGMTMGLFPIIGIPLPFISYGGSSLIGFTLLIGVFLKLARGN